MGSNLASLNLALLISYKTLPLIAVRLRDSETVVTFKTQSFFRLSCYLNCLDPFAETNFPFCWSASSFSSSGALKFQIKYIQSPKTKTINLTQHEPGSNKQNRDAIASWPLGCWGTSYWLSLQLESLFTKCEFWRNRCFSFSQGRRWHCRLKLSIVEIMKHHIEWKDLLSLLVGPKTASAATMLVLNCLA